MIIRHIHPEEYPILMHLLDRGFGSWHGIFPALYPHLYTPDAEACSWTYVVEEAGQLVAHVGLYPLVSVAGSVHLKIGGVGAVTTLPEARGRGYMSRLLRHVIREMRAQHYSLAWLAGNRQRYGTFGWEVAGLTYRLTFSRRSLAWRGTPSRVAIKPATPDEAHTVIAQLHTHPTCHMLRPRLRAQLRKVDMRYWLAEDGYIVLALDTPYEGEIAELVSASGREAGMLHALLRWTNRDEITWTLSAWDEERLARLIAYAADWEIEPNGMYRINDLTQLLEAAHPHLTRRATAVRNFAVVLGLREADRLQTTTLAVHNGEVEVRAGRHASHYVELSPQEAVRLLIGGPPIPQQHALPPALLALLPIPVHVARMDVV